MQGVRGEPAFVPTDEDRDKVKLMSAVGTRHDLIARMIRNPANDNQPICAKTLTRHFKDELEEGAVEANALVAKTAFDLATSGQCPAMTMFWLKTRAHRTGDTFRETSVVQNQLLDANGEPVDPPSFGVSFARGGPGQVDTSPGLIEETPSAE